MPIKIIKRRNAPDTREPAPLIEDASTPKLVETPEERSARYWKDEHPPTNAQPRQCGYCRQFYIKPCNDEQHRRCMNFGFLQSKLARAPSREARA